MSYPGMIGMNLSNGNNYAGSADPFIDKFKTAGGGNYDGGLWAPGNFSAGAAHPVPQDADGYPTSLGGGDDNIRTLLQLTPYEVDPNAHYAITWTGSGNFFMSGGRDVSASPHRNVVRLVPGDTGRFVSLICSGINESDPPKNIKVIKISDEDKYYNEGRLFNDVLVDRYKRLTCLRFMDWFATNFNGGGADWNARPRLSGNWGNQVPYEVAVMLANDAQTDMWFNLPIMATDAWMTSAFTYVRDNLLPGLIARFELSNEVWNNSFWQQAGYAREQGSALPPNGADQNWAWIGYRTAQMGAIANSVFAGQLHRKRVVLGTQTAWLGQADYHTAGAALAGYPINSVIDEWIIATYFGGGLQCSDIDDPTMLEANKAMVLSWARGGAMGMDRAFQQIEFGNLLPYGGTRDTLAALSEIFVFHGNFASSHGFNLVAYEGGYHMDSHWVWPAGSSDQQEVQAFFGRLMADPRSGQLLTKMMILFKSVSGQTNCLFNDFGGNSQYGYWGHRDSIYGPSSPRWDAVEAFQGVASVNPPIALPGTGLVLSQPKRLLQLFQG